MATKAKTYEERLAAYEAATATLDVDAALWLEARAAGCAAELDKRLDEAVAAVRRTERYLRKAKR